MYGSANEFTKRCDGRADRRMYLNFMSVPPSCLQLTNQQMKIWNYLLINCNVWEREREREEEREVEGEGREGDRDCLPDGYLYIYNI